jgi:choline-sulfatase
MSDARDRNVLLVTSDEHRPDALGCAGHPVVETPTLDRLAARGARFTDAYCPSPLCVPSRAALATGRYVHEIERWDNATPYRGEPRSWGHHFRERGVDVTTVGKLDFKSGVDDGFPDQRYARHRDSPDVYGLHRDPPKVRENARERILDAGPVPDGEAWYCDMEGDVTEEAVSFLEERAAERDGGADDDPWVCWASYVLPHFPLRAEERLYERYVDHPDLDLPIDNPAGDDHPVLEEIRDHFDGREVDAETLRRTRAAYYALCTALDEQIGELLDTLDRTGLAEDTLVVYLSDHGEPLGDHECWWKCCTYESAAGVPMIVDGPGVADRTVETPVNALDAVPTMADAARIDPDPAWRGRSLLPVARGEADPDAERAVLSEYHGHGVSRGMFMLRRGDLKYVRYPDYPDQLFDLSDDPDELENRAEDSAYADACEDLAAELERRVEPSPEAVDERARDDQARRLAMDVEEWW